MVGAAVLGHSTLAINQEAVPAALLGQSCLVTLSDEGVQLSLLTADSLHKLKENTQGQTDLSLNIWCLHVLLHYRCVIIITITAETEGQSYNLVTGALQVLYGQFSYSACKAAEQKS